MPELPAVEYSRRLLYENLLNNVITKVIISEDPIIYGGALPQKVENDLMGRRILDVKRHGKYLWLTFDEKTFLLLHFGMTGFVEIKNLSRLYYKSAPESNAELKNGIRTDEWPPRFWKLQVETDAGNKFVFGDSRRLGRIKVLHEDPKTIPPVSKLGFDPILNMPPFSAKFCELVRSRSVPLKTFLLDQSFAAGVGNWMADDILLHARLHPKVRTCELDDDKVKDLHKAIQYISETAVSANSDGSKFPKDWLFHYRWPADRKNSSLAPPLINGHPIEFLTISGRTSAFVPDLQVVESHKDASKKRPSVARNKKVAEGEMQPQEAPLKRRAPKKK